MLSNMSQKTLDPTAETREHIVTVADQLFYTRGVTQVTMDQLRDAAGVSLKKLYSHFPSKEEVVVAVLERRHRAWTDGVAERVAAAPDTRSKVLAVYDFLADWFCEADFRGCVFVNTFAELGATSPRVAQIVREHKTDFQHRLAQVVTEHGGDPVLAAQLAILAEGAQTTAAISGDPAAAAQARAAAATLIEAAELD
jgi:AcrR family transcriptional regulator